MSEITVIYATKTKHSKRLAEAIASELQVKAQNINENPVLSDTRLLFIVGGIYGGVSMPALLEYIKAMKEPAPRFAAIVTSCSSGKQKQADVRSLLEEKNVRVLDEFICKGGIFFVATRHPNPTDLHDVSTYAQRIVRLSMEIR